MARGIETKKSKTNRSGCHGKAFGRKVQRSHAVTRRLAPQIRETAAAVPPALIIPHPESPAPTLEDEGTDRLAMAKRTLDALAASGQQFGIYTIDSQGKQIPILPPSMDFSSPQEHHRTTSHSDDGWLTTSATVTPSQDHSEDNQREIASKAKHTKKEVHESQPKLNQQQVTSVQKTTFDSPKVNTSSQSRVFRSISKRTVDDMDTDSTTGSDEGGNTKDKRFEVLENFMIGDADKLELFYDSTFGQIQQLGMKSVLKTWIKEIEPKKSRRHPYCRAAEAQPHWWPSDVQHKEPDHLKKEPRHKLARCIISYVMDESFESQGLERLEKATTSVKLQFDREPEDRVKGRQELLAQLYEVARMERGLRDGERDPDNNVSLRFPLAILKEGAPRKRVRHLVGRTGRNAVKMQVRRSDETTERTEHVQDVVASQVILREQPLILQPPGAVMNTISQDTRFGHPHTTAVMNTDMGNMKPSPDVGNRSDQFTPMGMLDGFRAYHHEPYDTVPSTPTMPASFQIPHQMPEFTPMQGSRSFPVSPANDHMMHPGMDWPMHGADAMPPIEPPSLDHSFSSITSMAEPNPAFLGFKTDHMPVNRYDIEAHDYALMHQHQHSESSQYHWAPMDAHAPQEMWARSEPHFVPGNNPFGQ